MPANTIDWSSPRRTTQLKLARAMMVPAMERRRLRVTLEDPESLPAFVVSPFSGAAHEILGGRFCVTPLRRSATERVAALNGLGRLRTGWMPSTLHKAASDMANVWHTAGSWDGDFVKRARQWVAEVSLVLGRDLTTVKRIRVTSGGTVTISDRGSGDAQTDYPIARVESFYVDPDTGAKVLSAFGVCDKERFESCYGDRSGLCREMLRAWLSAATSGREARTQEQPLCERFVRRFGQAEEVDALNQMKTLWPSGCLTPLV
jgi:hypothetical protein